METWQIVGWAAAGMAALFAGWWFLAGWGLHRRQLKRLGRSLGLRLERDTGAVEKSGLLRSPLFHDGSARCENMLRGRTDGAEAFIFDYCRRGRTPDPVACFRMEKGALPAFELRPRLRPADEPGLAFDSNPRFGDVYALSGGEEAALRRLFDGEVLTFFVRSENQDWAVVSTGEWLAVTVWPHGRRQRRLEAKQVMGFVEDARQVLRLLSSK